MKIFRPLLLLCLPLTLSAQNASPASAPDLLIIDYKLGPFVRIDVSRRQNALPDDAPASYNEPSRYENKLKSEIEVRNIGARTIKHIDCEFRLTTGRGPTTEIRGLTIRFSKVLRPGHTARLSQLLKADQLGTWGQRLKEGSMSVGASITRIEYGDGSVWERGPLMLRGSAQPNKSLGASRVSAFLRI